MPYIFLKKGQRYLVDSMEFNESDKIFKIRSSADTNNIEVLFNYILRPVHVNSDPKDYTLFVLYKPNFSENDIFQIYDRESDRRIGWIFPLQSILSCEHDQAKNEHFLRYAFVAYQKLLINVENKTNINISERENYNLDDIYHENTIVCLLSNETLGTGFDFNLYLPNLYKYGYYIKNLAETNSKPLTHSSSIRFTVQKIASNLKDEAYIRELFRETIYEQQPLAKFHILYQVIELLLEKVLHNELEVLISKLKSKKIYTRSFQDKLTNFMAEEKRVNKLFSEYEQQLNEEDLQYQCDLLLQAFGKEEQTNISIPTSLYTLRNFIVHDYRNIPKSEIANMNEMNAQFEILVIDMLINFNIPS